MNIANLINEQKNKFKAKQTAIREKKINMLQEKHTETIKKKLEVDEINRLKSSIASAKREMFKDSFAGRLQAKGAQMAARVKAKSKNKGGFGRVSLGGSPGSNSPNIFTMGSSGGTNSIYHGTSRGNNNPYNFSSSKPKAHKKGK